MSEQEEINYQVPDDIAENLSKLGLSVPVWERALTSTEIQYFVDRWPFLQILSTNTLDSYHEVQLLIARKSNWTILNYGDAMASSPGAFLFGGVS